MYQSGRRGPVRLRLHESLDVAAKVGEGAFLFGEVRGGSATATREASADGSVVPMTMIVLNRAPRHRAVEIVVGDDEHASRPSPVTLVVRVKPSCSAPRLRRAISTKREIGHALEGRLRTPVRRGTRRVRRAGSACTATR